MFNHIWILIRIKVKCCILIRIRLKQCTSKNNGEKKLELSVPHMRTEINLLLNVITRQ
jgi:hypothetical protein